MTTLLQTCALVAASLTLVVPGGAAKADEKAKVKLELRRAETKSADGLIEAIVPGSKEKIYLHKTPELTNDDIAAARVVEDPNKKVSVEITFTKAGAKKMAALSAKQLDKPLAILIDGKLISAPIVKATISERAVITGDFTKEEAEKIAKGIAGS